MFIFVLFVFLLLCSGVFSLDDHFSTIKQQSDQMGANSCVKEGAHMEPLPPTLDVPSGMFATPAQVVHLYCLHWRAQD